MKIPHVKDIRNRQPKLFGHFLGRISFVWPTRNWCEVAWGLWWWANVAVDEAMPMDSREAFAKLKGMSSSLLCENVLPMVTTSHALHSSIPCTLTSLTVWHFWQWSQVSIAQLFRKSMLGSTTSRAAWQRTRSPSMLPMLPFQLVIARPPHTPSRSNHTTFQLVIVEVDDDLCVSYSK